MTMAGKRRDVVVEAEEQLLCGGGGFMVRSWRLEWGRRAGGVFIIFSFLGRVESCHNPPRHNLASGHFLGRIGVEFEAGLEVG